MAGPITWQNVGQPNFGDAANFMQLSMEGANKAFTNAGNRAKEQENLAKAAKTNSILSKINGITDEDTLRAFQDTIDFEDMGVDSNAIMDTLSSQSDRIQGRRVDAANISNTEQDTAASKANVALNQKEFDQNVTNTAFDQAMQNKQFGLDQNQDTRAATAAGLNNTQAQQQIDREKQVVADETRTRNLRSLVGDQTQRIFAGEQSIGGMNALLLEQGAKQGNFMEALAVSKEAVAGVAESFNLNPMQVQDIKKADDVFTNKLASLEMSKEAKKKEIIDKEFNGRPPVRPVDIDEEINTTQDKSAVLNEWVNTLKAQDPNAAELFVGQSGSSSEGNAGFTSVLNAINNKDSTLYRTFREKMGDPKAEIDPALFKAALGATTVTGQFWSDGLSLKDLAGVMAGKEKERRTFAQFQKRMDAEVKPTEDKIRTITMQRGSALEKLTQEQLKANQNILGTAAGNPNAEELNLAPTPAADAARRGLQDLMQQ